MINRSVIIFALLFVSFALKHTQTEGAQQESSPTGIVVEASPSEFVVDERVTITPRKGLVVDFNSWKFEPKPSQIEIKELVEKGSVVSFVPVQTGNLKIEFEWYYQSAADKENAVKGSQIFNVLNKDEKTKKEAAIQLKKAAIKEKQATISSYQAGVHKLLKDKLVDYYDENYSKNLNAMADYFEINLPEVKKATKRDEIDLILSNVEKEFFENDLKYKGEEVKDAWKRFFDSVRTRLKIELDAYETTDNYKTNQSFEGFSQNVIGFINALRASAKKEDTRIENYKVNESTYLNYMNKYSDSDSKFNKHHKLKRYLKHKRAYRKQ